MTGFHLPDLFSIEQLFFITLAIMLLSIEAGFRLGKRSQINIAKAQASQVRAIMGAVLGLLAFILAFSFATGQSHYEIRVQQQVEEAQLARKAYFQAEFLPAPYPAQAQQILHKYVSDRVLADQLAKQDQIPEVLELADEAEQMHQVLWRIAASTEALRSASSGGTLGTTPFTEMVSGLIDIHAQRVQAALMNRIPNVLWISLYLLAILAMLVTGYQAGLVGRRSPVATVSLVLAFSGIMMLITDLDRPFMSLFHMDNHVIVEVLQVMEVEQQRLVTGAAAATTNVDVQALSERQAIEQAGELGNTSWRLVQIMSMDDNTYRPDDPSLYTLNFGADGTVSLLADCNRGTGTWLSESDSQLQFGPIAATRAMCPPESLHDRYLSQFEWVRSYVLQDGHLFLATMADGSIIEFEPLDLD